MLYDRWLLLMSMSGCSDVTWTVSDRPETPRAMSSTLVWPSVSSTRENVFGVKPESLAVTSYAPGASDGNRKYPPASLTALATPPCERFLASTVTPGSTAPVLSFTVPSIEARCSWAAAGAATSHKPSRTARVRTRMKHPPEINRPGLAPDGATGLLGTSWKLPGTEPLVQGRSGVNP